MRKWSEKVTLTWKSPIIVLSNVSTQKICVKNTDNQVNQVALVFNYRYIPMIDFRLECCYCFEFDRKFDGPHGLRVLTTERQIFKYRYSKNNNRSNLKYTILKIGKPLQIDF